MDITWRWHAAIPIRTVTDHQGPRLASVRAADSRNEARSWHAAATHTRRHRGENRGAALPRRWGTVAIGRGRWRVVRRIAARDRVCPYRLHERWRQAHGEPGPSI